MSSDAWTIEEVARIVADYRRMLIQELNGQAYNKAAHNRRLQERIGRSRGSIERKHQNISAVLCDADCFYIPGYQPLGNYQQLLAREVTRQLLDDFAFDAVALQAADKTWLPTIDVDFGRFLVDPPRATGAKASPAIHDYQPVKRDYLAREAHNRSLGEAGEVLVMAYEKHRLRQLGKDKLAKRIEHASKERGDGLGYDVLSFETDGRERFIEVKSTAFGKDLPFYLSRRELEFSNAQSNQYYLYRLFSLREQQPQMFSLHGDLQDQLWLDPISYRAGVTP